MTPDPADEDDSPVDAPGPSTSDDGPSETRAIERTVRRLAPPGASVSALAVTADGAVVASRNPGRAVAPASNTKLLTAALALDQLGPGDRFRTALSARGTIDERVLDGDLVLRGTGAPDVTLEALAGLAESVAERVDRVTGNLVCDCSRFAGPQRGPGRVWTDEYHAYGARSSALALAGNVVSVTVSTAEGNLSVSVDPRTEAVDVGVDVTVDPTEEGSDDDGIDVRPGPSHGEMRVTGRMPPDDEQVVRVPVGTPVRHCGLAARETLSAAGVDVTGGVRVADGSPETGRDLGVIESAPVRELVGTMNVESNNFVADQLARTVAATAAGEGSWTAWRETVADHLAARGVETARIDDGSGLSRYNRIPANGIVALLKWATDRPWSADFFASLPSPGEGTLADRLDGLPVVAKTGTLTGARALSGRVDRGDTSILFSVLVGDITVGEDDVRDRQDAFVRALTAGGA